MATKKISALTSLAQGSIDPAADVLPIVDTGSTETKKATAAAIVGKSIGALADTWNDGLTTFTAIKFSVTDTASAAGSLLMDLQVGGTSQFKIEKDGGVNIGTGTIPAYTKCGINGLLPTDSATTIAYLSNGTIPSSTTTSYSGFSSIATTQNAAFTLTSLYHYAASVGNITTGSRTPPTNQYGYYVASNLVGATNNYGFLHAIPSASGRWGFYGEGTAANHFTGTTTFGTKLGYGTTSGVGGAVTQATSRTTGVTLNKVCGQITLVAGTIAGHEADEFVLTNSTIEADDVVVVNIKSGLAAGTAKYYRVAVTAVAAGSCTISVGNLDNGTVPSTGTDTPVLSFAVIKAVAA
jgi:hypothetical protein